MKTLHAAVIGCGLISKNHFKALKNVEHVCCTAVCDIDPDKARAAAEIHGIHQVYSDYKELLKDPDIDVVHICTPHYLHARMAIDALKAGKHVLCEKPMALTKEDAKQMLHILKRINEIMPQIDCCDSVNEGEKDNRGGKDDIEV